MFESVCLGLASVVFVLCGLCQAFFGCCDQNTIVGSQIRTLSLCNDSMEPGKASPNEPAGFSWSQLAPSMGLSGPRGAEYLGDVEEKHRGLGEKITYRLGILYLSGMLDFLSVCVCWIEAESASLQVWALVHFRGCSRACRFLRA
jgi:hypothetical protein